MFEKKPFKLNKYYPSYVFVVTSLMSLGVFILPLSSLAQTNPPGPFSLSGSSCFNWPTPVIEVNTFAANGATSYDLERRINGGAWVVYQTGFSFASFDDFVDRNISAGNTYGYRVIARNSAGSTTSNNTASEIVDQTNCSSPSTVIPSPILFSVSPTSAPVGATVILTGINLLYCAPVDSSGRCNVQFHDINLRRSTVSGIEESNTTVRAVVAPELCPGSTTIKVGEVLTFSNAIPFTILDQGNVPAGCRVITSIAPTSGTSGTTVTINGRNLHSNVQMYNSAFAKTDVTGTMNSGGTQVVFVVPNGLTPGTFTVRVGPSVSDVSNGLTFNFTSDTTAPYISNIRINNITTSGATVTWDTNESADTQVEVCTSLTRCGSNTPLISSLTTSHLVNLTGLAPYTRYYLWAKSKDGRSNLVTGGPLTFRTLATVTPTPTAPPQINSPIISNVQVTNITRDSATVTWNTDRLTDSRINSCFMIFCFGNLLYNASLTTTHSFTVSGLRANSNQYIQISGTDSNGNAGSSNVISFRTLVGLVISNLNLVNTTQTSFTVTWDTNYPADSQLVFCSVYFFCYFTTPIADLTLTSSHSLTASGLGAGNLYYYYVLSKDAGGYNARSTVDNTRTLP